MRQSLPQTISSTPEHAVTTRCGAIPEVAGDAALYFSETDHEDLQTAIRKLIDDANLREQKVLAGLARARAFSWDRTAELTADVYRSLV